MRLRKLLPLLTAICWIGTTQTASYVRADSLPQPPCAQPAASTGSAAESPLSTPMPDFQKVVERARQEVSRGVVYDPSYVRLSYPNGDVDPTRGVCTDVVVRSLRAVGIDLQRLVHEDILKRPTAYRGSSKRADSNIDHRRATPLLMWFRAHARSLPITVATDSDRASYAPGDILVWSLHRNGRAEHVGVVSDRKGARGIPLIIHNIGPHPTEEDVLDAWQMLGHYRAAPLPCFAKAEHSKAKSVEK